MRKFKLPLLSILFLFSAILFAQEPEGLFVPAAFCRSFISEISSTVNKVEIGYGRNRPEYDVSYTGEKLKLFVEAHLGFNVPLYLKYLKKDSVKTWGIALSVPVSVHTWEDMFENTTAPVLNTDYRFSFITFKAIKYFRPVHFIRNMSFAFTPINHECTHIGDELTICRKSEDLPLTRINVSYEYSELSFTLNDPNGSRDNLHSFRVGMMYRYSSREQGWYSIRPVEGDTSIVKHSNYRSEFYFEYQVQRSIGFLVNSRFVNVFSLEVRERLQYGYPFFVKKNENLDWTEISKNEKLKPTLSTYFGYRFYPESAKIMSSVGLYLTGYFGLNPHGQFRNMPGYLFFGVSLVVE